MKHGLNLDAGEYPDEPEALYALAHVVNVACGGHAGDDASMVRVLALCKQLGTRVGAHPSYADREGFGRRARAVPPEGVGQLVTEQCGRLLTHARALGVAVTYVKPHGALYHAANKDLELARAFVRAAADTLGPGVAIIGPPQGALRRAASEIGVELAREGFADRAVRPDGSLVPRDAPGALITDPSEAARRARELAASGTVDTVCVHADTPDSLSIARAVRDALDSARPRSP